MIRYKDRTEMTFRKPGELLLRTTINGYKKVWLLGRKYKEIRAG